MARPVIAWSYSALSMFENCPRKYWAVKIKKVDDTNAKNYEGDQDHQSIENFFKHNHALTEKMQGLLPVFTRLQAAPGEQYVEHSMTLTNQLVPCRWNDWDNAWVRGAGDYVKVHGNTAIYFDWKSGKVNKNIADQVDLTSLLLFRHFPQVEIVKGAMYFYNHDKLVPHTTRKSDEGLLWNGWFTRVQALEQAKLEDNWPATPNPLCGWCPYKACPNNKVDERLARDAGAQR